MRLDSEASAGSTARRDGDLALRALAFVPPIIAVIMQLFLWRFLQPSVWFLFYPAVFLSSWLGGVRAATASAAMCAACALWFFLPPQHSFVKPAGEYLAATVFFVTGVLFGLFHERLRRANARLRHAIHERHLFACLIDNSSDFIGIADPGGKPVYVNPAGRRMVGLAPDRPIGETTIPEYYPPDQRDFARDVIVKSMVETGHWEGETAFRNWETGSAIPVSDTHFTIRDPDSGETIGFGTVTRDISEAKRARDELEIARRKLEAAHADLERAQAVAKAGSWRLDVRRNVLVWSDENYRIFGVPHGTPMTYETFLECVHPDDRAYVDREWTAGLAGKPYDIEHRIVVDGTVKWVREKADLEFDEHHTLVGGIGITQDVTERKKYEQEMQDARERVELALRGADLGAWDWNIETGEVVFSARWAEMRGYRLDELRGHVDTWIAGVHPEDLPRVQKIIDDYLQGRSTEYEAEMRVRTKSGAWIWILDRGKVFTRDARGRPIRMVGTELDITARRRAEQELRRAEREQRLLAELGATFASTLEYEETVTTIARLATRDLADFCIVDVLVDAEVRRQTVESRDPDRVWVCDLFHRLSLDRSRPHLTRETLDTRRTVLVEHVSPEMVESFAQSEEHLRALRAMDPKSMIVAPLFIHGELRGALALVSSTESRVYGPSDVRLVEELAARAALAIENARLYRVATRAIQAREDVLGIVAHDLRNPLATILMQAGLLRRPGEGPERRSMQPAVVIERAATRMNRLIQDLLDVTRMEAGRLPVEHDVVPAAQVLFDSIEAQRTLAASASIDVHTDVPPGLPDVWGDRHRLLQVFENLIGNAIKFSEPGGHITVGAAPRAGEILFWVADTGAGIAAEDLPHVFDEFWQAAHAKRMGAGLGLPIVKGIVEAHGGRVWVESALGRGSIFFFTIPTAAEAEQSRARLGS